jgi:hypothetical protein
MDLDEIGSDITPEFHVGAFDQVETGRPVVPTEGRVKSEHPAQIGIERIGNTVVIRSDIPSIVGHHI